MKNFTGSFSETLAADKRRMSLGTLAHIADNATQAPIVSAILQEALKNETESYNQRMIIAGLTVCTRNGAPPKKTSTKCSPPRPKKYSHLN